MPVVHFLHKKIQSLILFFSVLILEIRVSMWKSYIQDMESCYKIVCIWNVSDPQVLLTREQIHHLTSEKHPEKKSASF